MRSAITVNLRIVRWSSDWRLKMFIAHVYCAVTSGLSNTKHAVLNLDGDILLNIPPLLPGDVNGDGIVNILDLTLVAQGFGTGDLTADVNGDGVVNVFDLVFVANAF